MKETVRLIGRVVVIYKMKSQQNGGLRTRRLGDQPYTIPNRDSDTLAYALCRWIFARKSPRDSTPPGIR